MSWSPFRDAKTRARWRETLMRQQRGLCALCGHRIPEPSVADYPEYAGVQPTFDHIVPRAHGGQDALHNLRLVHSCCNHIRGDGDVMERVPTMHRSLRVPPLSPHRMRYNAQGVPWCRSRKWKRGHATLASAWIAAFCSFLQTGRVHTPYLCGRSSKTRTILRYRISQDPWRFEPFICWAEPVNSSCHGCGFWHLTSFATHVLITQKPLALPKAMGWEAYHRAPDGSWVRKDRECIRPDGLPKKQFESKEHADRCARSMSVPEGKRGHRYHAYVCTNGHIHIGTLKD